MKKPSVPSRCGRVWRKPGTRPCSHSGASERRSSARKSPRSARNACTTASFSAGEIVQVEYTSVPPGRSASAPARRIAAWMRASRAGRVRRLAPARVGAGGERAEVASRAGRRGRGRRRRARAAARHRRCGPRRSAAPMRAAVRRSASARPGMALDGDDAPRALHQRGEVGRLAARRGAQVEHALAGPRREHARDGHRGARLRHEAALLPERRRRTRRTARRARAPRVGPARDARPPEGPRRAPPASARSVLTRSAASAGSLSGRHQRAGRVRAERVEPQLRDPLGMGVAQRGLGGVRVRQRRPRAPPPRARRGAAPR